MDYIGEHLLPGQIGQFFAILSLVASLVATIAFYKANREQLITEKTGWLRIARISFLLETISVVAMFGILYYIISHHYFEYKYAWQHSDQSLQVEYLLSCFWEGQEGSFMLWTFWHCVLGWIIVWRAKEWEPGVMTVMSFVQFALATMVIGVYFFDHKVGSSPFVLLRNEMDAPMFNDPNYLEGLYRQGGQGLNALLQNYWMVIHPPILFLGFASVVVPFAYAVAGLMNKSHDWIKRSIPWAAFSGAILGLGIMMGAAWAYESLSFGGYWAWDPVENASLVPWLTLVAGLHTNLIYKSSGYSLRTTYFFYIVSFVLVIYSTFLTRSGVLGDTSVHAFTDLGMNVQLYLFLNIIVWLPVIAAAKDNITKFAIGLIFIACNITSYYFPWFTLASVLGSFGVLIWLLNTHVPAIRKEESSYSREFWMYIGSLVIFLSAIIIIFQTSLPVLNNLGTTMPFFKKFFAEKYTPPEDVEFRYNQIQVFVAFIIGLLTAVTQYLKYKDTTKAYFGRRILIPTVLAVIATVCISLFGGINFTKQGAGFLFAIHLAIFAAVYAIIANASYIWIGLKGKMKSAGASIAHVGFGMVLLGVLISSSKKAVLSNNTTGIAAFKKQKGGEDPMENITLFKGQSTDMGKYMVTYVNDYQNTHDRKKYYEVAFSPKDGSKGFSLYPNTIKNNKGGEGFSANPDAKHYVHKDIFAYLTSVPKDDIKDTATFRAREIKVGDTLFYGSGRFTLTKASLNPEGTRHTVNPGDSLMVLDILVMANSGGLYRTFPAIRLNQGNSGSIADSVNAEGLVFMFNGVMPDNKTLELGVKESKVMADFVTLKVYEFPMINVLWLGVIVMFFGLILSVYSRVRQLRVRPAVKN
jgi:cytochrome c-type biogenesis protein CcmF